MTSCRYIVGDLLDSDCHVIAHQANCFSIMGAGIAKQIANQLPGAAYRDSTDARPPRMRLGNFTRTLATKPAVYNLYGQLKPGANTNYLALEAALLMMMQDLDYLTLHQVKIGVPYKMGCGIGGGDWDKVLAILERVSTASSRTIYIYVLPEFQSEVIVKQ